MPDQGRAFESRRTSWQRRATLERFQKCLLRGGRRAWLLQRPLEAHCNSNRVAHEIIFEQIVHAEVGSLDLDLAEETAPLVFVRTRSFAQHAERHTHRFRDAVDREIPHELIDDAILRVGRRAAGRHKRDRWKLLHIEEVGAAQVFVAFLIVGVQRARIDRKAETTVGMFVLSILYVPVALRNMP